MTPFLSPNFPLMYLKRCTHDFNLQLLLTIQLLTYKTSSRVNFHIGGHVCMSISVCRLISHVLSQLSCFHTNVSSTIRVHARVYRIKDGYLHTFWLTKTCLRVKFNISHRVLHLTSHWYTWNDVKLHDFNLRTILRMQLLKYETTSENISLTDAKTMTRVHCKKTSQYNRW